MMSIKSLMITSLDKDYSQEYIARVFWDQHIAKVSRVTLIPYMKKGKEYNIAYININEWDESESAYNFIKRLQDPSKEARIVYYEDDWWPVEVNSHNNGNLMCGEYTVTFDDCYYECDDSSEVAIGYCSDDECIVWNVEDSLVVNKDRMKELSEQLEKMDDEKPSSSVFREVFEEYKYLVSKVEDEEVKEDKLEDGEIEEVDEGEEREDFAWLYPNEKTMISV